MRGALLVLALVFYSLCHAVDTRTGVLDPRLRTLQAHVAGQPLSYPVIGLADGSRLEVSFDLLADEREYLRYELMHCNADWQPSGLLDSEFLDGFNQADIDDYEYSQLTNTRYVHYSLSFPNESISPLISGNYVIRIYAEGDSERTLAMQRFMVSEQSASVVASVASRTDIDYNKEHQQVSLHVDASRARVPDVLNDLIVKVQQNGREDNAVVISKPLRIASGGVAVYEHLSPLIFEAGNEYRRVEPLSVRVPSMGVEAIAYHDPFYHIDLRTDAPRTEDMYVFDQTQHGKFVVRERESAQSDIEADYVVVHFSLAMPEAKHCEIFLDGDFTYRRFDDDSRMVYNRLSGMYEKDMLLKQGAYNYQYLVLPVGLSQASAALVEGNKYQTVNEYMIMVYARNPVDRYDRLIAVDIIKSE